MPAPRTAVRCLAALFVASPLATAWAVPPQPPTIGLITAGDTQVTVQLTAPVDDGGSPVTGMTVVSVPADGSDLDAGTLATTHTVTLLANGTPYTFRAFATNAHGDGALSAPSGPVTPNVVPAQPDPPFAQAGNTTATITIVPPADNGGTSVTGYAVTSSPAGGIDAAAGTPSINRVITGLTNGVQYTFTVVATNAAGNSIASNPSYPVRPALPTATITVDSVLDDGVGCTLRKAVENSNGVDAPHAACTTGGLVNTIVFSVNGTFKLGVDSLFVTDRSLTVVGNGTANTIIDGQNTFRVFDLCACQPITLTLRNMTLTRGVSSGGFPGGGALFVEFGAAAIVEDSVFSANVADAVGGAILNMGSLQVTRTTFANNSTPPIASFGGAIGNFGTAVVSASTFTANFSGLGGAIGQVGDTDDGVSLSVVNSTFSGNIAADAGGAIASVDGSGPITLSHVTVSGNSSGADGGGGLYNWAAGYNVDRSIIAGNTTAGTGADCFGDLVGIASQGYNVFGTAGCDTAGPGIADVVGDPLLGALANNGGTTQTRKPAVGSLALNLAACNGSTTDQRAIARPQGPACDSGALEVALPSAPTAVVAVGANGQATITFNASATPGDSAITGYTVTSNPAGGVDSNAGSLTTSHVVTGLANGTPYTFTVRAANAYGQGPASVASNSVTPATVPGAPTAVTATAGNAQATVSFTAPANNGGSAITSYTATSSPGGITASGPSSPLTVTGLANGTAYTFTVRATNAAGMGLPSAPSGSVTPQPPTFTLTVLKAGPGSGVVQSTPVQAIHCGATCSATLEPGHMLTLVAVPAPGSIFTGFSGACTGNVNSCPLTMDAAKTVTATFGIDPNPPRLANISTRAQVLTGDDVVIGGFIIGGSASKTVVVRARGPSLTQFGVTGVLANPQLQLFSGPTVIASNDNWQDAANAAGIQSSGFAPLHPQESAILMTLQPGAYTAIVSGVAGGVGVAIVEVFEVDAPGAPLINIATRARVQTGDNVLIAGIIVQGSGPQTVVVRARGPSMAAQGVTGLLANPVLRLFSGPTEIASNDNWQDAPNASSIQAAGFAPQDANESAIMITLQPGAYTAIVTGTSGHTGVGIVEVFKN